MNIQPTNTFQRIYCHVFGMVIGFIEHLQIVTTSNSSAIANSHTQQFTTARSKNSQSAVSSPVVFTVTA
jgi:hypothetical protein